ncbi:transglycosylase domain-containing protein [Allosphingosinicella sp.]|jgi:penicillin-binding protein 1A|uniref:transglycosylase domain-containing protein n=1 Tax=Allosphingosinicella sp. TaxID=2823234 RepID=UPI002F04E282
MDSTDPSRLKQTLTTIFKVAVYALAVATVALGVAVTVAVSQLPSYQELIRRDDLGQMIRVRAADGSIIVSMGPSFGEWLGHDEIPPIMREAMIAVEDRRFRSHPGVDPIGIVRALFIRAERGEWTQGGSTITQQLARNIFLDNSRSFGRKIREGILAMALEWQFSKEQILELYLNRVYFGGGAYGIDAASRRFFGHSARELSIAEASIIAGLVKAPSNYSPTADAEAARGRAAVVIEIMRENETITAAQAAASDPRQVRFVQGGSSQNSARYFTDWALPQLDMLIDESVQPIDVWTTLDPNLQRAADRAINANTPGGAQGALVSLDRDGAVRAMVGGRNYLQSIYNRATQATRQPGSSFKLFVYLAALETGYTPNSTVQDAPLTIAGWSPRNDSGRFSGPVTLRQALAYSINTVAVRLAQEVGTRNVADMAQRMGITTRVSANPSMALGTSEVRLIDMTRAYASVGSGGSAVVPYGIRRVTTADGTLLYQHQSEGERVLVAPWVAAQMIELLEGVVSHGSGRNAALGRPTAGKTGTTTSNKDGWFLGFSSGITTGVWMGRDDSRTVAGLAGGRAPAQAFHDFMVRAVAGRPVEPFRTEVALPDGVPEPEAEEWVPVPEGSLVDPDGGPLEPADPDVPPIVGPIEREPAERPRDEDDGDIAPTPQSLDRALGRRPRPEPRDPPPPRRERRREDAKPEERD